MRFYKEVKRYGCRRWMLFVSLVSVVGLILAVYICSMHIYALYLLPSASHSSNYSFPKILIPLTGSLEIDGELDGDATIEILSDKTDKRIYLSAGHVECRIQIQSNNVTFKYTPISVKHGHLRFILQYYKGFQNMTASLGDTVVDQNESH